MSHDLIAFKCLRLHQLHLVVSVLEGDGIEALLPDAYSLGNRPERRLL